MEGFGGGICFVDLVAPSEHGLVVGALCSALGFDTEDLLAASQLIEQLRPVSQGRRPGYLGGRRGD
ncbi:hypothetical protein [Rhizobium sp. BK251]|uniref:hypothetical protein n=1 Tax=Rhizobium sp. BK251 TaxID=2512125 RepID=UPI00104E02A5|nr:hypothetical protein [Rhizobium sp. BK251]